jgi:hypothetical protein
MIDSKKIKQMVEHVSRRSRGVEDREFMYPMREWALGMAVTTVVVMVGALFSYRFYSGAVDLVDTRVTPVAPNVPYDAQKISEAIHKYQDKDKTYQSLVNNTEAIPPVVPVVENVVEEIEEGSGSAEEEILPEDIVEEENVVPPAVVDEGGLRAE